MLGSAVALFALWALLNVKRLAADQCDAIRLALGSIFALLILVRPKPQGQGWRIPPVFPLALGVAGTVLYAGGIVLGVHQFHWLGLMALLCACLLWGLPPRFARDVLLAAVLLYWLHPLPGQVFGPLQLAMQRLSVLGAEWLLQAFNQGVWADRLLLYTGSRVFGVPEACSGMRVAVAVFLCALGGGILLRFRWYELGALVLAALAQVLLLNILRIALLVHLADQRPEEWASTFIHDTLGVFLLAAVFLVQIEASLWRAWRRRWARARRVEPGRLAEATPAWRKAVAVLVVAIPAALLTATVVYKSRPHHRAMMIDRMVECLIARGEYEPALRPSEEAHRLAPGDLHLQTRRAQVLMLCGRFAPGLRALEPIPRERRNLFTTILCARGLIGLGRWEEAVALLDTIPSSPLPTPPVAMLKAELASGRDDIEGVVANIVKAAEWGQMAHRVRALFPYLAARRQWQIIARCRSEVPYKHLVPSLIAIHACLRVNDLAGAGDVLRQALQQWPDEPRLVRYLAALARIRPGSLWEQRFARKLRADLPRLNAEQLAEYVDSSFLLARPDLAWLACNRLAVEAPDDPIRPLLVALFADVWFTFRKQHAGIPSDNPYERIYLGGFCTQSRRWVPAPLMTELSASATAEACSAFLERCIGECRRREAEGALPPDVQAIYGIALALAGRHDELLARLPAHARAEEAAPAAAAEPERSAPEQAELDEATRQYRADRKRARDAGRALAVVGLDAEPDVPLSLWYGAAWALFRGPAPAAAGQTAPERVLTALAAAVRAGDSGLAATLLSQALTRWPHDARLIGYLAALARRQPGSDWERQYERRLLSRPDDLSEAELAAFIETAFRLTRPELAWFAYRQLQGRDPRHPALLLAPGQFGDAWFVFRRKRAGLPAESEADLVDLRVLYAQSRNWPPVPLADELRSTHAAETRRRQLRLCLAQLAEREKRGQLPLAMQLTYESALELAGRQDEARRRLDQIAAAFPERKADVLVRRARLLREAGAWQELYETLIEYGTLADRPRLSVNLMLIDALLRFDLGMYAMAVAQESLALFPGEPRVYQAIASIWSCFGFHEQALFTLQRHIPRLLETPVGAELFYRAQRFDEARRVCRSHGSRYVRPKRQALALPQAEIALAARPIPPLTETQLDLEAARFRARSEAATSPFVRALAQRSAEWCAGRGRNGLSEPDAWVATGRNQMEQAAALKELALLLARHGQPGESAAALQRAVDMLPHSAILWRMLFGLQTPSLALVQRARAHCPDDPELWLGSLVLRQREEGAGPWGEEEIDRAVADRLFSVDAMVRAGDFMLRNGMSAAACKAARYACEHADGLLPAYLLAFRCAVAATDRDWALSCASYAALYSLAPAPFLKAIAAIKTSGFSADDETVDVLRKLTASFPAETGWTAALGDVYLRQGRAQEAVRLLDAFMGNHPGNVDLRTRLLAAEAARRAGRMAEAVGLLEALHSEYPASRAVLNNLVYTLALEQKTLPRARELLPELLRIGGDSFSVLDTAAFVWSRADQPERAAALLKKAMAQVDTIDPWWLRANPRAVDVEAYLTLYDEEAGEGAVHARAAARDTVLPLVRELDRKVQARTAPTTRAP